jgi:hypothetical protein
LYWLWGVRLYVCAHVLQREGAKAEKVTYDMCFNAKMIRGKRIGTIKGWPMRKGNWCLNLKLTALQQWNSIALPQWWWITCKMAAHLPEHATLGSLFDGIGGFPLVWETRHGKGTAVWASEIEEFPIAVTKDRFK